MLTPIGSSPPPNTAADMAQSAHSAQPTLRPHRATPEYVTNPRRCAIPTQPVYAVLIGHTVLNLGMSEEARGLLVSAFNDAKARSLYPPGCYMASNKDEYWAEGTQV